MPIELYFFPLESAPKRMLTELCEGLSEHGLKCRQQPDGIDQSWVIFDGFESTLCVSVVEDKTVFATLHWVSSQDDIDVTLKIDKALEALGWTCAG